MPGVNLERCARGTYKRLFQVYLNESADGLRNNRYTIKEDCLEIELRGDILQLTRVELIPPGLIKDFEEIYILSKESGRVRASNDFIKEKLGVSSVGAEWLNNNIRNWAACTLVDQQTKKFEWGELLEKVEKKQMSRTEFLAIVEQHNPMNERWYHPLAYTQEGHPYYMAYLTKYYYPDERHHQIGSFPLQVLDGFEETEAISSNFFTDIPDYEVFPVHPENAGVVVDLKKHLKETSSLRFVPLASVRVGFVLKDGEVLTDMSRIFKISYLRKVTSRPRIVPWVEHEHSIEITNLLKRLVDDRQLSSVSFLPDIYARRIRGDDRLSYRIRGNLRDIYPPILTDSIVFPSFGLYYYSKSVPRPLIMTLIERSKKTPKNFLLENVLTPIIHGYFDLAYQLGLIHESHGQNMFLAYNLNDHTTRVILKDLESMVINTDFMERYEGIIDPDIQSRNETPMSIFTEPNSFKEKVSKRFHHWVMRIHLEPILDTVSYFYGIAKEELYTTVANVITNWWIKERKSFAEMERCFELDKLYLRNYLYTNKVLNEEISPYQVYNGIPFVHDRDILKSLLEKGEVLGTDL